MKNSIEKMKRHTDLNPWYWYSYGEKCYAFAVVEAITETEDGIYPEPGTELMPDEESRCIWIGENGTRMIIENEIANIERQNGNTICEFIAKAHAHFLKDAMSDIPFKPTKKGNKMHPDEQSTEENVLKTGINNLIWMYAPDNLTLVDAEIRAIKILNIITEETQQQSTESGENELRNGD